MNPTPIETTTPTIPVQTSNIEVAVAVLTEKVTQVIGDHERRISALETINTNRPTKGAALVAPIIAAFALIVLVADKVSWQ